MALHELTTVFASPGVDWTGSPRQVAQRFHRRVREIQCGLYIQYFENDAAAPVYDKNRTFAVGGEGALVIHANGASLKPGKFQYGLVPRRRQDADHLHRVRGEAIGSTYADCLKLVFVLDLSGHREGVGAARRGEKLLKKKVDAFIERRDLLRVDATRRGDWRKLNAPIPRQELLSEMRRILRATAAELGVRP